MARIVPVPGGIDNTVGLPSLVSYYLGSSTFSFLFDLIIVATVLGLLFREGAKRAKFGEKIGAMIGAIAGLITVMSMYAAGKRLFDFALWIWIVVAIMLFLTLYRWFYSQVRSKKRSVRNLIAVPLSLLLPVILTLVFLGVNMFPGEVSDTMIDLMWLALLIFIITMLLAFLIFVTKKSPYPGGSSERVERARVDMSGVEKKIKDIDNKIKGIIDAMTNGFKAVDVELKKISKDIESLKEDINTLIKGVDDIVAWTKNIEEVIKRMIEGIGRTGQLAKENGEQLRSFKDAYDQFERWVKENVGHIQEFVDGLSKSAKEIDFKTKELSAEHLDISKKLEEYRKRIEEMSTRAAKLEFDEDTKRMITEKIGDLLSTKISPLQAELHNLAGALNHAIEELRRISAAGLEHDREALERIKNELSERISAVSAVIGSAVASSAGVLTGKLNELLQRLDDLSHAGTTGSEVLKELKEGVIPALRSQLEGLQQALRDAEEHMERVGQSHIATVADIDALERNIGSIIERKLAEAKIKEEEVMNIADIKITILRERDFLKRIIPQAKKVVRELKSILRAEMKGRGATISSKDLVENTEKFVKLQNLVQKAQKKIVLEEKVVFRSLEQLQKARDSIKVHMQAAEGDARKSLEFLYEKLGGFTKYESQFMAYLQNLDQTMMNKIMDFIRGRARGVGGTGIGREVVNKMLDDIIILEKTLKDIDVIERDIEKIETFLETNIRIFAIRTPKEKVVTV